MSDFSLLVKVVVGKGIPRNMPFSGRLGQLFTDSLSFQFICLKLKGRFLTRVELSPRMVGGKWDCIVGSVHLLELHNAKSGL